MKTAVYIEDGVTQLVLTPESDFERRVLASFTKGGEIDAQVFSGSFYDCRGGWVRQSAYFPRQGMSAMSAGHGDDDSLIVRARKVPEIDGRD